MHALSTASGDEEDADQATQSRSEVRGLRKRWASMATTQSLTPLAGHEIDADDLFGRSSEEQFNFEPPQKFLKTAQTVDPITVVYGVTVNKFDVFVCLCICLYQFAVG